MYWRIVKYKIDHHDIELNNKNKIMHYSFESSDDGINWHRRFQYTNCLNDRELNHINIYCSINGYPVWYVDNNMMQNPNYRALFKSKFDTSRDDIISKHIITKYF